MIHEKPRVVNASTQKKYHPSNAPHLTAGVRYGNKIRSEGTSKRILNTPPAIAYDYGVLTEATADGCDTAEVFITDTKTLYTVSIAEFWKYGRIQTRFGKQVVLSLRYWTVNSQAQPQPQPVNNVQPEERQPEAAQLALFGGAA